MCGGCRLREQCTHSSMGRSLKHHLCQDELDSCSGANRPDAARCRLSVGCDGSNKIAVTGRPHFAQLYFCSGLEINDRFESIVVQNDAYLLQLSYYIHRNPVRAGIVKRLADYRWSSYRVYAYGRKTPDWLATDLILSQFKGESDRQKSYREKV